MMSKADDDDDDDDDDDLETKNTRMNQKEEFRSNADDDKIAFHQAQTLELQTP